MIYMPNGELAQEPDFEWIKARRFGRFILPEVLVKKKTDELARTVFARIVIIRAEFNYARKVFLYDGVSDLFESLAADEPTPIYSIIVSDEGTVSAKKVLPNNP
jgi:hypothetical protein